MKTLPLSTGSHNASASMIGYLFQARYALLRGLEEVKDHPSHFLSIERFDDVTFEDEENAVELIQTKHHGKPGNVWDSSVDLWKTLRIWVKWILENPTDIDNTRFVFLTTNSAADGSALSMLRQTTHDRDETRAIALLTSIAKNSDNHATATACKEFLNLTTTMRAVLVGNIWVFDNAPNIINVRDKIEKELYYAAPAAQVSELTDQMEGWWFRRVINAMMDQKLARIPLADISNKVSELREGFKVANLVLDENIEKMAPASKWPNDERTFIYQMKLVEVSKNERMLAAHDFHRAYTQRSQWVRKNLLLDEETNRYDRALSEAWHRRFLSYTADLTEDCDDHTKITQGKRVFRWAREYQKPLRNRDEIWLSSGSLQILADQMRIGWHPDYETLVSQQGKGT